MQERDDKHEQTSIFNTEDLWLGYKKNQNGVVICIREAKEQYYSDLVKENMHNSKRLWKTLKVLLPSKRKNGAQSFVVNGVFETESKAMATAFNSFLLKLVKALLRLFRAVVKILCSTPECLWTHHMPSIQPAIFCAKRIEENE